MYTLRLGSHPVSSAPWKFFLFSSGSIQSGYNCRAWSRVACWWCNVEEVHFLPIAEAALQGLKLCLLNKTRNNVLSALVPSTSLRGKETDKTNQHGINTNRSRSTDCYKCFIPPPKVREQPEFSLVSLAQISQADKVARQSQITMFIIFFARHSL